MAVDEALLESAVSAGVCTVRWYRWKCPTVSLGYFQSLSALQANPRLRGLPVVRRLSGGGAIVHDRELTYSCAVPAGHRLSRDARQLYTRMHERVIGVLAGFGFAAALRGTARGDRGREFLCFGRGDDFDVVMGDSKVLGSAQRRRKGAVLQHGSLVLESSETTPEFPGVFDCGGRTVPLADLAEGLARASGELDRKSVV